MARNKKLGLGWGGERAGAQGSKGVKAQGDFLPEMAKKESENTSIRPIIYIGINCPFEKGFMIELL